MMIPKTFLEILKTVSTDHRKVKYALGDKRLSFEEKEIVSAYIELAHNENELVLNRISKLAKSENEYVYAQKNLLLAIAHNNLGHFQQAKHFIFESLLLLETQGLTYYQFIALHNLFTIECNLKNKQGMAICLQKLERLDLDSHFQLSRLRCHFNYHVHLENWDKASELRQSIRSQFDLLTNSDQIAHLIDEFEFYLKQDHYDDCFATLEEMKNHRNYNLKENYNFMKKLLLHLTKGSPLYSSQDEFEHFPILKYEFKIIQALSSGQKNAAVEAWKKLETLYPSLFAADFNYLGDKCLFSLCINKHLQVLDKEISKAQGETIIEQLKFIFESNPGPFAKEDLYKMLWGSEPKTKDDFIRLSRSIYRLKNKYDIHLKLAKGAYSLDQIKKIA
jgi:hypothetical protein